MNVVTVKCGHSRNDNHRQCVVIVGQLLSGSKGCDGANTESCQHAAF